MPMPAGYTCRPLVKLPKDPAGCWEWLGAHNGRYGVKEYMGKSMPAARWIWKMLMGPIDDGLRVSQTCGNFLCVNPQHLVLKSAADIAQAKSGLVSGDVNEIRLMMENGHPAPLLATKFGIDVSTVYRIANRRTWKQTPRRNYPATETGD